MCRSPSKRIACFPKQFRIPFTSALQKPARPMQARLNLLLGIGTILAMGIGDTIRVSLTGDPIEEIRAAKEILKSLGLLPILV